MTRNEEALMSMVSSTIVEFHNAYAAQPVKKFQDKATAVRRTAAVLEEAGMEFDEFCQLQPKPVAEQSIEARMAANLEGNRAEERLSDDKMAQIGKEIIEQADKKAQRASADRQPTLKGQRLAVVGGKDAANPFREGSKSHAAFAMVQANPGKTYEELRDMGARMRTITHSTKQGWIRAL